MIRHNLKAKTSNQYGKKIVIDGITFGSKLEGSIYTELKKLKESGVVIDFFMQVPIYLPGNTTAKYKLDYLVFASRGTVETIEVKGKKTAVYSLKKRLIEANHPFDIIEVYKVADLLKIYEEVVV